MKEKKLIASVVLGVSFVSLVTAIIAGFAACLTLFIDMTKVVADKVIDFVNTAGAFTLIYVLLGVAFIAVFCACKKQGPRIGLMIASIAWCVIALIVLRVLAGENGEIVATRYTIFTSYLTATLTFMVSMFMSVVGRGYLMRLKKKEESVQTVPAPETDKGIEQAK